MDPQVDDTSLASQQQGRNLIVCCDGTNNQFGSNNTNVVRLVQVIDRNPLKQRLFYDAGVGTLPEPASWGWLKKVWFELSDLAFAAGLPDRVASAYGFLMETWQPGDRVFLFGFSRGAYTVRVLAGLLYELGLLPLGCANLVPYAYRLFKAIRKQPRGQPGSYWDVCDKFRWTFARRVALDDDERRFPVHFLGVWDTVSSVGWVWNPTSFPYTHKNPGVSIVRHAVSIDERRAFFRSNLVEAAPGQDLKEGWFPGVHCDVGGGYSDSQMWRTAFDWMIREAQNAKDAKLLIDADRLAAVRGTSSVQPWADKIHESLDWKWWPVEFAPKFPYSAATQSHHFYINLGRRRTINPGSQIHKSALQRMIDPGLNYSPPNIPESFRSKPLDAASEFITL
jgi:uncharacterized protein (DUF2235 family)